MVLSGRNRVNTFYFMEAIRHTSDPEILYRMLIHIDRVNFKMPVYVREVLSPIST